MKDDLIYIIAACAGIAALTLGIMWSIDTSPAATARRYHRYARELHGCVTCEFCKELMKGSSHEQR